MKNVVSVCMATYNAGAYLPAQIASILADIGDSDELVVVDDGSSDGTLDYLRSLTDPRVRVHEHVTNIGHVRTFEHALSLANGEYIAMSDQDDLWPPGRTNRLRAALDGADLAVGNFRRFGSSEGLPRNALLERDSGHGVRNLIGLVLNRRAYFGSCMMLRRSFAQRILIPFPENVEAHDHWIAVAANATGSVAHVDGEPVTLRRVHSSNLTPKSSRRLPAVIKTRMKHLTYAATAVRRR